MFKNVICISLYLTIVTSELEYGEFDLFVTDYLMCRGPKQINCANQTITRTGNSTLTFNMVVKEEVQKLKGKLVETLNQKELLRMQWKDICDSMILKPYIQAQFHIKTDDCYIRKGTYTFTVDVESVSRKFYGGKFIFGNWTLKLLFYTENCNMLCGTVVYTLKPSKTHH